MSSISSVAPASTSTSTPPPLKTIVTIVAHGHGGGPMDLTGLTMHQRPVDLYGGASKGPQPGALANNPIVKAAKAFITILAKGVPAGIGAKIGSDLWGKYGNGIMSALARAGSAFLSALADIASEIDSAPRSGQAAQTTTLSPADQSLAENLMSSAKQVGVASLIPGAVKAVFTAMQSSGAIVDTTA